MARFVAFLRGVSPMNAKMPQLKRAFEDAGFTEVKTLLSSGNVVFNARARSASALARQAEAAMTKGLDRSFQTVVRPQARLQELIASDPYAAFQLPAGAKRVVTFLGEAPKAKLALPIEMDSAQILSMSDSEVLSAYVPGPRGPVFMALIEKTFGKGVTTRTWDTVRKCAAA